MFVTVSRFTNLFLYTANNGKIYLLFFCFFLSRGGSFKALMIKDAADGTTEMVACLF